MSTGSQPSAAGHAAGRLRRRALRGLTLVFLLSFVNLAGAFVMIAGLGGPGEWTVWQFVGLFGVIEAGLGLAFIVGPNIWRLPVAEAQLSDRTAVRLAAATVLRPHWAAAAKAAAGAAMVAGALVHEGGSVGSSAIPVVVFAIATGVTALSLAVARLGVARPDLDVLFIAVSRPGRGERSFPGLSVGGLAVQFALNIGVIPLAKVAAPTILYRSAMAPSAGMVASASLAAAALGLLAWWAWRGRIVRHPAAEQQREAEAAERS